MNKLMNNRVLPVILCLLLLSACDGDKELSACVKEELQIIKAENKKLAESSDFGKIAGNITKSTGGSGFDKEKASEICYEKLGITPPEKAEKMTDPEVKKLDAAALGIKPQQNETTE